MDTSNPAADPTPATRVRVWDLPTRLFHWLLAVTVVASLISANVGGAAMVWHFRLGYVVFALLAFRVLWGFFGGRWSRFTTFVRGPGALLRYLRGDHRPDDHFEVGHNPLASLSVLALLAFLAVQVATGLVGDDEIANVGPLNRFVEVETGLAATSWHKTYGQYILIAMVVLHIAAILYYLYRKKVDLLRPMFDGDKSLPAATPASRDDGSRHVLAGALVVVCAAAVGYVVRLGS